MLTPQRNHDAMSPWHVVLVALAGWLNREQQKVIEYLKEENRVLREQLGTKRLRFNDEQRRRLTVKGKELGIKVLREQGCSAFYLAAAGAAARRGCAQAS